LHSASVRWGGFFDVDGLRREIDRLNDRSNAPGFWDDPEAARKLTLERATHEATVTGYDKRTREVQDLVELLDMAAGDEAMIDEVCGQIPDLERAVRQMEVARMLAGPEDRSDCIVSIHPGTGGVDAQDWAEMVFRMYLRWCEKKGYKTEIVDQQAGEQAGLKDATFHVRGPFAYGYLRAENGVHRLIRISPFDANARRQTAFASVEVVPDLDDDVGEIIIKPEDLQVDTFRAGGKGGQHVNKTESAIRITHIPSGIIVACQAERSQHKNRATAMKMLRGKIYELERQKRETAFQEAYGVNKLEIGFGSQVRTYTMAPYQLVKDERTEVKVTNVQGVLDGDLDELIEAYLQASADTRATNKPGGGKDAQG
jgi:peptide chain release factor 2